MDGPVLVIDGVKFNGTFAATDGVQVSIHVAIALGIPITFKNCYFRKGRPPSPHPLLQSTAYIKGLDTTH